MSHMKRAELLTRNKERAQLLSSLIGILIQTGPITLLPENIGHEKNGARLAVGTDLEGRYVFSVVDSKGEPWGRT